MSEDSIQCPLCYEAAVRTSGFMRWPVVIKCERCGSFQADESFLTMRSSSGLPPLPLLSGLARNRSERGEPLLVTSENHLDLQKLAPTSVMDRVRALLRAIARKSPLLGQPVVLNQRTDYTLGYCTSENEINFMLVALKGLGWVISGNQVPSHVLTIQEWSEVDRLAPSESVRAFVAMWFADEMTAIYEQGIKPSIEDGGYRSVRVDDVEHVGKIDDLIIAEIRESRFVVADFTGHRGGVYFEAGFALGLGLPVIWTCRKDHIKDLHFDIRQYNCIDWDDPSELRTRLANRIRAAIGSRK
jgi:nucleoside 2-deoxyribosyltransferase